MRIKYLNNSAFSLLEVLLASVIFIVSVAGVFATLNAVRGPVYEKENQLEATVFGKEVLEALFSQVSDAQATPTFYAKCVGVCTTFDLSLGLHRVPAATLLAASGLSWPTSPVNLAASNSGGLLRYTVTCADGVAAVATPPYCSSNIIAHEVVLNINWP